MPDRMITVAGCVANVVTALGNVVGTAGEVLGEPCTADEEDAM
jgi:hypothetical protein